MSASVSKQRFAIGSSTSGHRRFGGLQFWGVGLKKDQTRALGNREPRLAMPPGIVEDENDAALLACADRLGEVGQQLFEERLADAVRQIPDRLHACRLHEGGDIEPFVAMMAGRQRPLADGRPDATAHRLQAEAMLSSPRPRQVDPDARALLRRRLPRAFLKATSCSAVAAFGFLGRGAWIDQHSFFDASQPRGA